MVAVVVAGEAQGAGERLATPRAWGFRLLVVAGDGLAAEMAADWGYNATLAAGEAWMVARESGRELQDIAGYLRGIGCAIGPT